MTTTTESREKSLAELLIHETIRDRITTAAHITYQMYEVHGSWRHIRLGGVHIKHRPRVDYINRSPEHEEFKNNNEQHLDDALFGLQTAVTVALTHARLLLNLAGTFMVEGRVICRHYALTVTVCHGCKGRLFLRVHVIVPRSTVHLP